MQKPPKLLLNEHGQALLSFLEQQAMEIDLGVDLRLPIHESEGKAHSVFDPVSAPDSRAKTTAAIRNHEVLLSCTRVG